MVFTRCLSFLGALLLLSAVFFGAFALLDYHWSWNPVAQYWRLFLKGWLATVSIAGIALPLVALFGYKVGAGDTANQGLFALAATYALLPAAIKVVSLLLLWRWQHQFEGRAS